ncbi:hypothetical protein Y032_0006g3163 [Ancylostoma ceylanicum]|uniref:Uncharacterized protein n=1 Tax=Ancylostoma ceylanicum TaxID=53326 RepID=A0A016VRS5_9BILA|nr:hypothetical protein Y032_0006g3163 [Ancylostoma ceylanicum]
MRAKRASVEVWKSGVSRTARLVFRLALVCRPFVTKHPLPVMNQPAIKPFVDQKQFEALSDSVTRDL